jgi:hypothetical protein
MNTTGVLYLLGSVVFSLIVYYFIFRQGPMSWTDPIDDGIDYLDKNLIKNGVNPERIPRKCRKRLVRHVREANTIVGGYTLPENLRYGDQLVSLAEDLSHALDNECTEQLSPRIESIIDEYELVH